MTLPASGTITMAQVNTELGNSASANISLNQSSVRSLFGKASGTISLNDGHSKSAYWNTIKSGYVYPITVAGLTVTFTNPSNGIVMGLQPKANTDTAWWGFEVKIVNTGSFYVGISDPTNDSSGLNSYGSSGPGHSIGLGASGTISSFYSGTMQNMGSTGSPLYWMANDVIGVRMNNNYIKFYKNGIPLTVGGGVTDLLITNYSNIALTPRVPAISCYDGGSCIVNFGASAWSYFVNGTNGEGWHV